jgi:hypothetical protein
MCCNRLRSHGPSHFPHPGHPWPGRVVAVKATRRRAFLPSEGLSSPPPKPAGMLMQPRNRRSVVDPPGGVPYMRYPSLERDHNENRPGGRDAFAAPTRFSRRHTSRSPDQVASSAHTLLSTSPRGNAAALTALSPRSVGTPDAFLDQAIRQPPRPRDRRPGASPRRPGEDRSPTRRERPTEPGGARRDAELLGEWGSRVPGHGEAVWHPTPNEGSTS